MYDFRADLKLGEQFETELADWIAESYPTTHRMQITEGYFPDYDMKCVHCDMTIECKLDRRIAETKNFCFELPLLQHSKADYLFYKDATREYVNIFELELLREWLRERVLAGKLQAQTVGENDTQGFLVKKFDIIDQPFVHWLDMSRLFKIFEHIKKS